MSGSWKRNVIDEVKNPYKKQKNDRLRDIKGLSVKDFEFFDDDEFDEFDESILNE